ncbi:hypothetical protein BJ508DRAFT_418914 [Ascobolus immersus RN42]|uniref:Extracellular membrane protein CFEM domain-containing protein n=1 Tax=Ascobolus immersus RN42 TaxID=1160509 RepID=A0A3N4HIG6_ASCIM|nr:hypothetical protein BJ508DRAFT_418914 [Ascobolus immersus RN42]
MKLSTGLFTLALLSSPIFAQIKSLNDVTGSPCGNSCWSDFARDFVAATGCTGASDWSCICRVTEKISQTTDPLIEFGPELLGFTKLYLCTMSQCKLSMPDELDEELRQRALQINNKCHIINGLNAKEEVPAGSGISNLKTGTNGVDMEKNLKALEKTLKDLEEAAAKSQGMPSGSTRIESVTLGSLVGIVAVVVVVWHL